MIQSKWWGIIHLEDPFPPPPPPVHFVRPKLVFVFFILFFVGKLPEPAMARIGKSARKYVTKRKKKATMLPESRVILQRLYENFNLELATILNDRKYTWDKNS